MKRLSSFGFVPSALASSSQDSLPKRAKGSQPDSSSSSASTTAGALDVVVQEQPQRPQVCLPQRSDLGMYSAESLRQLSDEERLWLIQ